MYRPFANEVGDVASTCVEALEGALTVGVIAAESGVLEVVTSPSPSPSPAGRGDTSDGESSPAALRARSAAVTNATASALSGSNPRAASCGLCGLQRGAPVRSG